MEMSFFFTKLKKVRPIKAMGFTWPSLAELPKPLITRAAEILAQLENEDNQVVIVKETSQFQLWNMIWLNYLFLLKKRLLYLRKKHRLQKKSKYLQDLKELDILEMTPLEAMNTLYQLHKKLK